MRDAFPSYESRNEQREVEGWDETHSVNRLVEAHAGFSGGGDTSEGGGGKKTEGSRDD